MDAKYTIINYRANFGEKSHGNAKNNMKSLKRNYKYQPATLASKSFPSKQWVASDVNQKNTNSVGVQTIHHFHQHMTKGKTLHSSLFRKPVWDATPLLITV